MEETRRTNKKKLVVAFALLALIVVASVITTVVLVLAWGSQAVQSNVNVTYTVTDVSAVISGKYGRAGATALTDMTTDAAAPGTDNVTYTFEPEQAYTTAALKLRTDENENPYPNGIIALETGKPYAIFEYKFVNRASADKSIDVALTYKDDHTDDPLKAEDKNIVAGYFTAEKSLEEYVLNGITRTDGEWNKVVDTDESKDYTIAALTESVSTGNINFVNELYFYVVVRVDNFSQGASFSGSFNFTLTSADLAA